MPAIIVSTKDLDPVIPFKQLEHNPGDGILIDDVISLMGSNVPPNSRTIIDRQKQYLKIEYGRAITLFFQSPDVDVAKLGRQFVYPDWKKSRLYVMADKLLVHQFDQHPETNGAKTLSKEGHTLEPKDVIYAYIDQTSGNENLTLFY